LTWHENILINALHHFNQTRPDHNHLLIFGRYPIPGRTKTRLIPALGALGAAELHRRLTEETVATARRYALDQARRRYSSDQNGGELRKDSRSCRWRSFTEEPLSISFYYDGGTEAQFENWLGASVDYKNGGADLQSNRVDFHRQTDGDLGQKMRAAIASSFRRGADKVVLVGTDLPDLTSTHLMDAFNALNSHDLVLGPSMDGGYWLVGLRRGGMRINNAELDCTRGSSVSDLIENRSTESDIFDGIDWSTERVFSQTLTAACRLGLKVAQLDLLNDLDTPDDLYAFYHKNREPAEIVKSPDMKQTLCVDLSTGVRQTANMRKKMAKSPEIAKKPVISVIIPALNEAAHIADTIDSARHEASEIIVVDGGSRDSTVAIAAQKGVRVVTGARGRAAQQNLGAEVALGEILLFLHADTLLPPDYAEVIFMAFLNRRAVAGAFRFRTDSHNPILRLISAGVNLRSQWLKMPYGDQALFFRRSVFEEAGRFPQSPVAEDLLLIRKLFMKKELHNRELAILPVSVTTSARRWHSIGIVRTTIINIIILSGIMLGVSPGQLAWLYGTREGC